MNDQLFGVLGQSFSAAVEIWHRIILRAGRQRVEAWRPLWLGSGTMLAAFLLWSCSKGADMEERYTIMARAKAPTSELCVKAQEVAQAYLDDGKQQKYEEWHQRASDDCFIARMLRSMPGEGL